MRRGAKRMPQVQPVKPWRQQLINGVVLCAAVVLLGRAFDLQVLDREFLEGEGAKRAARHVEIPALRGAIRDRNGEPLALSAPVESIWVTPADLLAEVRYIAPLADLLGRDAAGLQRELEERRGRQFYWLERHLPPSRAERITALGAPGVASMREYRRYYPNGEISAHLVGLTDIDGRGLEGFERAAHDVLAGQPGKRRVVRARDGRVVEAGVPLVDMQPGRDLYLTIDVRLQYLAHRELKAAVQRFDARGGMVVIADVHSGDVLAMASQPSYNPNRRDRVPADAMRNRVLTDVFEPGSTVKPLLVAHALEERLVPEGRRYETGDGWMQVGRLTVRDVNAYGTMDLARMLQKSSNVGAAKLGLEIGPEAIFNGYQRFGFGAPLYIGFPGTANGLLRFWDDWGGQIGTATAAYGYGMSTTALHLLRAYAALANDGVMPGLRLRADAPAIPPERVVSAETARRVRAMLEGVVSREGTARQAAVPGFAVAGKTGTTRKVTAQGYADNQHQGLFVGMLPAHAPRFVALVMIDEPRTGGYYGGVVAAPVFSNVMQGAAHWLQLSPGGTSAPGFTTADARQREPRS